MLCKLRSRRGETLTETLAAILMVSLASVVLMTLVVTASRINRAAGEGDKAFRAEQEIAETQGPGTPGTVTLSGKEIDGAYSVNFSSKSGALTAYSYRKGGGT